MQILITLIFIGAIVYVVRFLTTNKKTVVKQPIVAIEKNITGVLFYQT